MVVSDGEVGEKEKRPSDLRRSVRAGGQAQGAGAAKGWTRSRHQRLDKFQVQLGRLGGPERGRHAARCTLKGSGGSGQSTAYSCAPSTLGSFPCSPVGS